MADRHTRRVFWVVVLLVTVASGFNLATLALLSGFLPGFEIPLFFVIALPLAYSVILAELAIVAFWGVFALQTISKRTLLALGMLVAPTAAIVAGSLLSGLFSWEDETFARNMLQASLLLPLYFFGFQTPLWILRLLAGASIVIEPKDGPTERNSKQQFRLIHIFGATTCVAVLFLMARWITFEDTSADRGLEAARMILGLLTVGTIYGVAILIPAVFATLGSRRLWRGLMFLGLYLFVATAIAATIAYFSDFWSSGDVATVSVTYPSICLGSFGPLISVLLIFRTLGYRLDWSLPWRRKRVVEDAVEVAGDAVQQDPLAATE